MINVITIFGIALRKNITINFKVTSLFPVECISFFMNVINLYEVSAASRMIHAVDAKTGSFMRKKKGLL